MDAPPEIIAFPILLRLARDTYVGAIRAAQAEAGCDDMPRNGTYVIGAMANRNTPLADVIEEIGMSKQAAGQLVDTLVLRGYIDRAADPNDRRRLTLSLTDRGRAAAEATRSAINQIDAHLIAQLGAEQVATTRATLAAIHDLGCDQHPKAPPKHAPAFPLPPVGQAEVEVTRDESLKSPPAEPTPKRKTDTMAQNPHFESKTLDDASFQKCSMRQATFNDVNLSAAHFSNVNLGGARLQNVNLTGAEIDDANIDGLKIFGHDVQSLIRAEIRRTKST
jgi:DNA-binding MarR family transcriptional regulator